ncbi:hypothetical protein BDY19DRAFT_922657 [Irpex rosettiformis]|uniref:Uncharacterized protein n=1 Tax=Irpex rosettiformis TaxID=378272 RepID=A0ACB8UGN2_9APHY|nr:hypothetical protein BDY19DRAFT_922657 [Irpex rosettiformis]
MRTHRHSQAVVYLVIALISVICHVQVAAQNSTAKCKSGFDWMSNSLGQSPCLIAAYLGAECSNDPASYVIQPSVEGYYQSKASATLCNCNTVAYSLFSACAYCQTGALVYETWAKWKANCSLLIPPPVSQYPEDIPNGTAVPAWAYYNVTDTGFFNVTTAEAFAQQNSSEIVPPTASAAPSSSSVSASASSTTIPSASGSASNGTQTSNAGSSSHKHAGTVIGGVLGVVTLLIITQ